MLNGSWRSFLVKPGSLLTVTVLCDKRFASRTQSGCSVSVCLVMCFPKAACRPQSKWLSMSEFGLYGGCALWHLVNRRESLNPTRRCWLLLLIFRWKLKPKWRRATVTVSMATKGAELEAEEKRNSWRTVNRYEQSNTFIRGRTDWPFAADKVDSGQFPVGSNQRIKIGF